MVKERQKGFTIVELLVVIVVIAVLAAVTVAGYNGIQQRAKISGVTVDLVNIGRQMKLFHAEHGSYPSVAQDPRSDLMNVLKAAGLYEATRFTDPAAWAAGQRAQKRFVFCTPEGDNQRFAVVADAPILADSFSMVGTTTYYIDESGGVKEMVFTESVPGSIGVSLCATATGVGAEGWPFGVWNVWSNAIPTNWAS